MSYSDEDGERDEVVQDLPEVWLAVPGNCCMCGKQGCRYGCFQCGRPVCMDETNYMADSACGAWIMDWWSNGAMNQDDGNEFWCRVCLERKYGVVSDGRDVEAL